MDRSTLGNPFYDPPSNINSPQTLGAFPRLNNREQAASAAAAMAVATAETFSEPYNTGTVREQQPLKLSKQVHVIGFRTKARFITHSLAPIPELPPVKLLTHHFPRSATKWYMEGRTIDLHDAEGNLISSHPILCPEYIGPRAGFPGITYWNGGFLDNIVVNTSTIALHRTLRALQPYIDNRTTICLIHEGLGVVEMLNEDIFDDPEVRPTYILGHLTHKLSRHLEHSLAFRTKSRYGCLLLSALPRDANFEFEAAQREHFCGLVSMSDALNSKRLSWGRFLHRKLPGMIWSSVADTISVILGCRYDQILEDSHAQKLWRGLLDETLYIVASLPEFSDNPAFVAYFLKDEFRKDLVTKLQYQGPTYSDWISWIRRGEITPVNFINGYFVQRARELGIDHRVNSMAVSMVKARHQARVRELRSDIPFSLRPYMLDSDRLGGREFDDDLDLDL